MRVPLEWLAEIARLPNVTLCARPAEALLDIFSESRFGSGP
jgi:hypothetical protein